MKKMIITVGLILITMTTIAEGEKYTAITNPKNDVIELNIQLQPITPIEATFEDTIITNINIKDLQPITPTEATFEDEK
jgi:hypothetical protein